MIVPHTPGPWTVEIEDHQAPANSFAANVYSGEPRNGTYHSVARVPQPEPVWSEESRAEVEANARLIAAAPEILAALEEVATGLQYWLEDHGDQGGRLVAIMLHAREVIERAKGGAS